MNDGYNLSDVLMHMMMEDANLCLLAEMNECLAVYAMFTLSTPDAHGAHWCAFPVIH
jgi:hypothetical protein